VKGYKVYFVLYIVLVVELLAVIQERDILQQMEEEIRDKMITTIAEVYKKDLVLNIPEKFSEFTLGTKTANAIAMNVVGLYSKAEQDNIQATLNIAPKSKKPRNWPDKGITLGFENKYYKFFKDKGNLIFESKIPNSGKFTFVAECNVLRVLPDYLPDHLMTELKNQIGDTNLNQKTKPENFTIKVKARSKFKEKEASWDL